MARREVDNPMGLSTCRVNIRYQPNMSMSWSHVKPLTEFSEWGLLRSPGRYLCTLPRFGSADLGQLTWLSTCIGPCPVPPPAPPARDRINSGPRICVWPWSLLITTNSHRVSLYLSATEIVFGLGCSISIVFIPHSRKQCHCIRHKENL